MVGAELEAKNKPDTDGIWKAAAKKTIRRVAARHGICIVVASLGRSGSTILTHACAKSLLSGYPFPLRARLSRHLVRVAWSIDEVAFKPGFVYKTHDYPPKKAVPDFVRIVYTFADPIIIVASLLGQHQDLGDAWIAEHAAHMKVGSVELEDVYSRDVFELERHFDQWMAVSDFPLFAIHYDKIWEARDKMAEFLSVPLTLPSYRKRRSSLDQIPKKQKNELLSTYDRLREKIKCREM